MAKQLNIPIDMTKRGREMFLPPFTGTLVRIARDGRWVVVRSLQTTASYWDRYFWRRVKEPAAKK